MGKKIKVNDQDYELPGEFESLDDLVKHYAEINGKLPTLQEQAALAEKFKVWGNPDDLQGRLNAWVQKQVGEQVERIVAEEKAKGATNRQANAAGDQAADAIYERWAELSPQQQIAFMQSQVGAGVEAKVTEMAQKYWAEAQKQLGAATGTQQQQFDLLARALDMKLKNPDIDLTQIWKTMTDMATAKPEQLMEMAMKSVTLPKERETWEKESRAKWEQERKDQDAADKLKVLNSDSVPQWMKPKEERISLNHGGEDALRNKVLGDALQNGSLRPEQI